MESFELRHRNPGHWDVNRVGGGRLFCIRGEPGDYYIRDERPGVNPGEQVIYKTIPACMAYIVDELMYEEPRVSMSFG